MLGKVRRVGWAGCPRSTRGGKERQASAAQEQGIQIVALAALWLLSTDICTNQLQALPQ